MTLSVHELRDIVCPNLLRKRGVFITGGGSGINYAIADAMASVGADVAICGRSPAKLEEAAQRLRRHSGRVLTAVADVRDQDALRHGVERAADEFGGLDTVVAGAAGNFFARAEELSANGFRAVVEIDLIGSFNTAQASFKFLRESRGSILFVSAGQSYLPFANQSHVGAAKAAVDNLMANLAGEWGRYGIRSNSIVPGPIRDTEGMRRLAETIGDEVWTKSVALGRFGDAREVASMAVVLASPLASYVTGARIVVDGGLGLGGLGAVSHALAGADGSP
ncbi:short-chain dehydrogenase [Mycolicibacterium sp. (ex Dasyatis americana)]|nr:short-chain dehydrogenase [Mycolicibacterium sp. (ex Dasyatis americana)]